MRTNLQSYNRLFPFPFYSNPRPSAQPFGYPELGLHDAFSLNTEDPDLLICQRDQSTNVSPHAASDNLPVSRRFSEELYTLNGKTSLVIVFGIVGTRPSHPLTQYVFLFCSWIGGSIRRRSDQETSICEFGGFPIGFLQAHRNRFFQHLNHLASYTRLLNMGT
jgi:hypothetical protein